MHFALVALAAMACPATAWATGAEMRSPFGSMIALIAVAGVFALQFFTLLIESMLPRTWPRAARWAVAMITAPILAGLLWAGAMMLMGR